jgi:hypothetical protein
MIIPPIGLRSLAFPRAERTGVKPLLAHPLPPWPPTLRAEGVGTRREMVKLYWNYLSSHWLHEHGKGPRTR